MNRSGADSAAESRGGERSPGAVNSTCLDQIAMCWSSDVDARSAAAVAMKRMSRTPPSLSPFLRTCPCRRRDPPCRLVRRLRLDHALGVLQVAETPRWRSTRRSAAIAFARRRPPKTAWLCDLQVGICFNRVSIAAHAVAARRPSSASTKSARPAFRRR